MRKPVVLIKMSKNHSHLEFKTYSRDIRSYLKDDYYVISIHSEKQKETTIEIMRLSEMDEDDFFNAKEANAQEQERLVNRLKALMEEEKRIPVKKEDSIVKSVLNKYQQRSDVGQEKYGKTMDRKDLNPHQWLTHLQEELMDATLYIEKLIKREL